MRSWNSASDSVGNMVANSMKNAANSRIQLLTRKAPSRDSHESSRARDLSSGIRLMTKPKLTISSSTMKTVNTQASWVS